MLHKKPLVLLLVLASMVSCRPAPSTADDSTSPSKTEETRSAIRGPDNPVEDYLPDSYTIDSILIVEGVSFPVFPDWTISKVGKTVILQPIKDDSVRLTMIVESSEGDAAKWSRIEDIRVTELSELRRDFYYTMSKSDSDRIELNGHVALDGQKDIQHLVIRGAFSELDASDRKIAGQLWQMIHWIFLDSDNEQS